MNLPIPVPSQTGGPQYALDEQSCFQQIDAHNHTPGQGIPIPLNALNINQNLDMGALSVTNLKSISFLNQAISPGSSSLYMLGNDLYWTDGTGAFDVQITSGNAVAVSGAVGFSGLPSGTASAAYLSLTGTFRFQSATNTGATLDVGPIKTRNTTASSNAVTITPPNPLPADYSLTLPNALPATDSFVVSDNSGNLTFQSTAFVLPAGVMMMYGGTAAPIGWLFCDGSIVSQATYSNLFAVVGTAFNTGGEGAGNFRLPDMRRRVPMGAGGTGSGTIGNAVGNSGGAENVTLTTANLPSAATTTSSGTHTHTHQYATGGGGIYPLVNTVTSAPGTQGGVINSAGAHTHTISGATDTPTNIVQSSLIVNYIIKY
jgi:microcystin-dependent protein